MPDYQYSYAAPSVQGCCTFGARGLHFYRHYYSKVFTVDFRSVVELRFLIGEADNSSFFILHSNWLSLRSPNLVS